MRALFHNNSLERTMLDLVFEEIRRALHLRANSLWHRILRWSIWKQATRFSQMAEKLDRYIGRYGLQEGARRSMQGFFSNLTTHIQEELPRLKAKNIRLINEEPRTAADGKKYAFIHPESTSGVLVELYQI